MVKNDMAALYLFHGDATEIDEFEAIVRHLRIDERLVYYTTKSRRSDPGALLRPLGSRVALGFTNGSLG